MQLVAKKRQSEYVPAVTETTTVPEHEPLRTITVTSGSTRQCTSDVAEDDDEEVDVAVDEPVAVAVARIIESPTVI